LASDAAGVIWAIVFLSLFSNVSNSLGRRNDCRRVPHRTMIYVNGAVLRGTR
jgi:hypothetical protein